MSAVRVSDGKRRCDQYNGQTDGDYHWCSAILSENGNPACHYRLNSSPRTWWVFSILWPNTEVYLHLVDCDERQCIKDMDGAVKRPKIRYCSISDPFVLIIREDDTLGLFVGDPLKGRIRRKDMTPMGEKVGPTLFFFS